MACGFHNEAQKSKVKGWQWSLAMFILDRIDNVRARSKVGNVPAVRRSTEQGCRLGKDRLSIRWGLVKIVYLLV